VFYTSQKAKLIAIDSTDFQVKVKVKVKVKAKAKVKAMH